MNLSEGQSLYAGEEHLQRVTHLIRDALAAVEAARPGCFDYEGESLRGTIERDVYHRATQRPEVLRALERALRASGVRSFDFTRFVDASHSRPAEPLFKRLTSAPKARTRLLLRAMQAAALPAEAAPAELLFCATDPRFVTFFEPFIRHLGPERCAVLPLAVDGVEEAAARRSLRLLPRSRGRARLGALARPPRDLFAFYASAVMLLVDAACALAMARPRTVVFAEGASPQEHAMGLAARAAGIPTVRVQHGRAGVLHPGYYDMPCDKMLMWGAGFAERIRPFSPASRYVVTGSPLFDAAEPARGDAKLSAFAGDSPVVTIITQPVSENILEADYRALVEVALRLMSETPDVRVLVRLHPMDRSPAFASVAGDSPDRVKVTRAADHSLRAVLDASALVLGLFSTVLSEAAALGTLPIVLRLGARHRIFPAPEDEGAAVLAESFEAATAAAKILARDAEARARYAAPMRDFARRYFGPCDGRAVARICHHISHPRE
jgi:hypothetical protein